MFEVVVNFNLLHKISDQMSGVKEPNEILSHTPQVDYEVTQNECVYDRVTGCLSYSHTLACVTYIENKGKKVKIHQLHQMNQMFHMHQIKQCSTDIAIPIQILIPGEIHTDTRLIFHTDTALPSIQIRILVRVSLWYQY